ncbi:type III-B CRISPR module RAMP protein Cmr4 [Thermosipho globiformans]|uniref:type III-B CRISPR module RAMP protein Cmr4 n=1 Tax=Thermosipho globiformans TaxID=380685 RepID=UPI000F8CDB52|nr:type III-B CRISPR module RAMP protein Cmr4 [Thermosipho globiformans]
MDGKIGFLYAVTQVHAGKGIDVGVVDQPIQREIHTGFPIISGIKGALRNEVEFENEEEIFGSEPGDNEKETRPGNVAFSEAKILFFPVRSLNKGLIWITCPMVLSRLKTAFKIVGNEEYVRKIDNFLNELENEDIEYSTLINEEVSLEEYAVKPKNSKNLVELIRGLNNIAPDQYLFNLLFENLIVLKDEDFSFFVKNSTEIQPRIRIDKEKGIVAEGALWYEEYLPQDTIMYFIIKPLNRSNLINDLIKKIDGIFINIGGKTTIGKGFTYITVL